MAATLMSVSALQAQTVGWSNQSSPSSNALYGVSFSDPSTWVAVGDGGTILRSSDGGLSWALVSSPVADQLRGVSFHGNVGLAVGIAGHVLRTTDAGLSWTQENRPTTRILFSVSMGNRMDVITGEEGWIFVSTDEGLTWTPRTAGTASPLFGVSVSGDVGVGVGGLGATVNSANRGAGWGLQVLGAGQAAFYATSFVNNSTGWAVGSYTPTGSLILRSDNSAFTWVLQTAPTTSILFGVSFATFDEGTVVGFNGTIAHTTNGGASWTIQPSGVSQTLNSVSFADPLLGIAVGGQGTILRTSSGGLTSVKGQGYEQLASTVQLHQNYPNPFNPSTKISYHLSQPGKVILKVLNLLGQEVEILDKGSRTAGVHEVQFDGKNFPSGVYFYRLESGNFVDTRRMVLAR